MVTMTNCCRIPVIRPPQDQRGARLSNDEDYQSLPIVTYTILYSSAASASTDITSPLLSGFLMP